MFAKQKQTHALVQTPWHRLSRKDVLARLRSRSGGLTRTEIRERRSVHGTNELPRRAMSPVWRILLSQLASPLILILFIAAAISLFSGDTLDVWIIFAAIGINAAVGFWQEFKADRALARLHSVLEHHVTVSRDGHQQRVKASELVPGDVMYLEAGDRIGADGRILECNRLQTMEASLTGESGAIDKIAETIDADLTVGDRRNCVFMGTSVLRGNARVVVVQTGLHTEIGHVAALVKATKELPTPLQTQLGRLSRLLIVLVIATGVVLGGIGLLRGIPFHELLIIIAALAVAAVPEGLLVSLTVVLVIGMQRILRQRGLVRRLVAAETLGSVTIVCSDKTGTLTKGQMQVARIVVEGEEHDNHEGKDQSLEVAFEEQHLFVLKAAALCNNAYIKNPKEELHDWEIIGDQTDAALFMAAVQAGFDREKLNEEYVRLDEIPFNESYKFMATLHHVNDHEHMVFAKGAPEVMLSMCTKLVREGRHQAINEHYRGRLEEEYKLLAAQGLRVLAVAFRPATSDVESFDALTPDREKPFIPQLVFVGWVGLKDPVRPEIKRVFATMQQAGVRQVIVTGDHPSTVQAVVRELGWEVPNERILTGLDLEAMDEEALARRIGSIDVFARVEPSHKMRIVQAFRKNGEVVAMLGDGVNDAPALKAADIGVAVNAGTDIAKETADLLLLDNHFGVILAAIREGRVMFDNIRRIFIFLVSDSFAEVIVIGLAMLFQLPMPLTAVQILWMNLVSDTFPNLALTLERASDDVMRRKPRLADSPIVNKQIGWLIGITTIAAGISAFVLYAYVLRQTGNVEYARTIAFTMTSLDSMFYVLSIRHLHIPLWRMPFFSNPALFAGILLSLSLQMLAVYVPVMQGVFGTVAIGAQAWLLILAGGLLQIGAIEAFKARFLQRM